MTQLKLLLGLPIVFFGIIWIVSLDMEEPLKWLFSGIWGFAWGRLFSLLEELWAQRKKKGRL